MFIDSLGLFALPNEKSADGQSKLDGWIGQTGEPSLLRFEGRRSGSGISKRGDILIYFAAGSIIKARSYLYGSSSLPA